MEKFTNLYALLILWAFGQEEGFTAIRALHLQEAVGGVTDPRRQYFVT